VFSLSTDTNPVLGSSFRIDDASSPTGSLATAIAFGSPGNRSDPFGLHINPTAIWIVLPYSRQVVLQVPTDPSLSGTGPVLQAVALAPTGTFTFSNSMAAILGTW
jgi:hypothetical protein